MLEHGLFGATPIWRRARLRPIVLAVFAYRHDTEFVPGLLQNIAPMVDGWVALDDRRSPQPFSGEPERRRILINRARELGATWVLAIDPDERIEWQGATRIRILTAERSRIIWEFELREMFTASSYRVDGIWGRKLQGRLFPVFDGPLCSDQPLHGAWCMAAPGYSIQSAGLNLYHLKMMSRQERVARRDLYSRLDPDHLYQPTGYDYLVDDTGAEFEQIAGDRDFFPAVAKERHGSDRKGREAAEHTSPSRGSGIDQQAGSTMSSQLGQLRTSVGEQATRESRLAVIIIGFRAPKSLRDAVRSIAEQEPAAEIIVVNSGGGAAAEVLGDHARSVVLVELGHAVRVGAARNIGIQISHAPVVAFLAGDCTAEPGWVRKRLEANLQGECAVGSVVENDKPRNPFASAAHLMTYGHRMPGSRESDVAVYGASYDRTLFDKYGFFSEALPVGEDSEFHARFREHDSIWLHASIRTIHRNPGNPISFLADQFSRGRRARHLADFFGIDFGASYIARATVQRVARAYRSSRLLLDRRRGLSAIASWPALPLGGIFYLAGMIASYLKARHADRLFQHATRLALFGEPADAAGILRRAIVLRPATARYHLALSSVLGDLGRHDEGARELHFAQDLDRRRMAGLISADKTSRPTHEKTEAGGGLPGVQVVLFANSSALHLAQFLRVVRSQKSALSKLEVFVVGARESRPELDLMLRVKRTYRDVARFICSEELADILLDDSDRCGARVRSFLVVCSSSCLPGPDWLAVLRAQVACHPEVELFYGSCVPAKSEKAGLVESLSYELGLFPLPADREGNHVFRYPIVLACAKDSLVRNGQFRNCRGEALNPSTLAAGAMKAGASRLFAPDWQTSFRMDSTLSQLLKRAYHDGYFDCEHLGVTYRKRSPQDHAPRGLLGSAASAWRVALEHFNVWRFGGHSIFIYPFAFMLLYLVAGARQLGSIAGAKAHRSR